ncbi:MAG: hypothetical protein ACLQU4_21475 [Limisphaerales bacterium]
MTTFSRLESNPNQAQGYSPDPELPDRFQTDSGLFKAIQTKKKKKRTMKNTFLKPRRTQSQRVAVKSMLCCGPSSFPAFSWFFRTSAFSLQPSAFPQIKPVLWRPNYMQTSIRECLTKQPTVEPVILLKATQSDFISMWLAADAVKNQLSIIHF